MDGDYFLIKLVRKRPILWNKSKQGNNDMNARNIAWRQIAGTFGVGDDWIRSRWYNLRERFVKELRNAVKDKQHIRFKYFNSMTFLLKHVEFRKKPPADVACFINQLLGNSEATPVKNMDEFVITKNDIEHGDRLELNSMFIELTNCEKNCHPLNSMKEFCTIDKIICNSHSDKPVASSFFQRNYQENCIRFEKTNIGSYDTWCEDKIFGELVAATLKRMNETKKNGIKKEIINILLS